LNIPDTSGRDSLFQAESRRCKEIIDIINNSTSGEQDIQPRHFCIFDELYSGTNPSEATKSAYAFLLYISKRDSVDFILTTHYVSICKKLKRSNKIANYKMIVDMIDMPDGTNNVKYTYKMKKGISKIQGAILILEEMKYPSEIINEIRSYGG
jgi:DNA mismatch repair ATPase MutS